MKKVAATVCSTDFDVHFLIVDFSGWMIQEGTKM